MIHAAPRKVKWGREKSRREILKGDKAAAMPPQNRTKGRAFPARPLNFPSTAFGKIEAATFTV